jgi:hypothetical protein
LPDADSQSGRVLYRVPAVVNAYFALDDDSMS